MLAAISLHAVAIPALGLALLWPAVWLLPPAAAAALRTDMRVRPLDALAAVWLAGLLGNHLLLLLLPDLSIVRAATLLLAGTALATALWRRSPGRVTRRHLRLGLRLADVAVVSGLVTLPMVLDPIEAWDARSIWFFHARMLYFAGGLVRDAGWLVPELAFAHPDYPKLVAGLAAQIASGAGYWNEYGPKGALVLLGAPVLLFVAQRAAWRASWVLLLLVLLVLPGSLVWNGYMDAWLAGYAVLAALGLVVPDDFASGTGTRPHGMSPLGVAIAILSLGVLPLLKNEGLLLAGLLALAAACRAATAHAWPAARTGVVLGLALTPAAVWWSLRAAWGLEVDLAAGSAIERLAARATDAAAWSQLGRAFATLGVHWPLLALAVMLHAVWRRGPAREVARASAVILAAALAYLVVVAAVLLSTPSDLVWHLSVTASRITLPTASLCGTAVYLWLDSYERQNSGARAASPEALSALRRPTG